MKIISKYKDYYDYLSDIWGVDEKLVLDRRTENIFNKESLYGDYVFEVHICGTMYNGYKDTDGNIHWGLELLNHFEERKPYKWSFDRELFIEGVRYAVKNTKKLTKNRLLSFDDYVALEPVKSNRNEAEDCPILVVGGYYGLNGNVMKFPYLEDLEFNKVLTPDEIYLKLTEWLSRKITESERVGEVDNDTLIQSKGMDLKRSFRPKMKK